MLQKSRCVSTAHHENEAAEVDAASTERVPVFHCRCCRVVREQDVHAPGLSEHGRSLDETGSVFQQAQADQQQGQHQQLSAGTVLLRQHFMV